MSTTCDSTGLGQTAAPTHRLSRFLKGYWEDFHERRRRRRLRATLSGLSDRELIDIGASRGEIDYIVMNRGVDPRDVRPAEWLRYLPTADGQIGPV